MSPGTSTKPNPKMSATIARSKETCSGSDSSEPPIRACSIFRKWRRCSTSNAARGHITCELLSCRRPARSGQRQSAFRGELSEVGDGARADMLDDLSRRQRAETRAGLVIAAANEAGQEAGGKEVAGAGRVDKIVDRRGRHRARPVVADDDTPFLRTRDDGEDALPLQRLDRGFEIGGLVQRMQLALIAEDDIERAAAHEIDEFVAIEIDAKRVG